MRSLSFRASRIALCLLPLAIGLSACASGAKAPPARTTPSAAASPPGETRPPQPAARPDRLQATRGIEMENSYDLPEGAKVVWKPDLQAGNCIKDQRAWTDTSLGEDDFGTIQRKVVTFYGDFGESCGMETSRAFWNVSIKTRDGYEATAYVKLMSGGVAVPKVYALCERASKVACTGGEGSHSGGRVARPPVRLGPLEGEGPHLECGADSVTFKIGQKIENHHICTIHGYPRPTIKVEGLPAGLTLTRYPTEHDSWLVLNGTVNRRLSSEYVAVEASLPSGWRAVKDFFITVE
jgi:hypothetical protein